jgi:hypothetical protein
MLAQQPALAQQSTLPPMISVPGKGMVPIYRASYFSKDNTPLHVEVVTDISGRDIQPIGTFPLPPVGAPPVTTQNVTLGSGDKMWTIMDKGAEYAIYLSTENFTLASEGDTNVKLAACGLEHVAGKFRAFVEATPSTGPACSFPKVCTCFTGTCCCR